MNFKDNIIFFLSIFPIFSLKSNLNTIEIISIFSIFLFLIFLNFYLTKFLIDNKKFYLSNFYYSFVITIGLDNHLGLFNGLIQPYSNILLKYFVIIYIPTVLFFLLIWLLIFLIKHKTIHSKSTIIFMATLTSLLVFNIFDDTKNYKNIPYVIKDVDEKYNKRTLVMIWDEMSGFNSISSNTKNGLKFNKEMEELFNRYNFEYYTNSFSISDNSVNSISTLINFEKEINEKIRDKYVKKSENYFIEYEIKKKELFEKFKNISVIQNLHINFCNNSNVYKCYQYNPYMLNIINANTDYLSKIISLWNLNGSIIAKLVWRTFKQFELITSINEPEGEKLFIEKILETVRKDLLSKNYDLTFIHILVPHKPYGLNKLCNYDVKLSNLNTFMSLEESINQHNIERRCVVKFINEFFTSLGDLKDLNIFILSDHGSRINDEKKSSLSNIFAHKNFDAKNPLKISEEKISQEIFREKFND